MEAFLSLLLHRRHRQNMYECFVLARYADDPATDESLKDSRALAVLSNVGEFLSLQPYHDRYGTAQDILSRKYRR